MRFVAAGVSGAANHRGSAKHECGDFLLGIIRDPLENDGSERGSVAGSGAEQCGTNEERGGMKRMMMFLGAAIFLSNGEARAQQPEEEKRGSRAQERGGGVAQRAAQRTASEGGDLAADNLDRVAATAGQIWEILSSDAGLMVEFKRMIAQDASAGGQLLEESDLNESALAERLYEDLRMRALATRLLQRYGYLLPKLNPDSGIALEQKLVFQERAQILARAGEKGDEGRGAAAGERNAGCDPQQLTDCAPQRRAVQKTRGLSDPRASDGFPEYPSSPRDEYPTQPLRPDVLSPPREQRMETAGTSPAEALLASSLQANPIGTVSGSRSAAGASLGETIAPMMPASEAAWSGNSTGERGSNGGATPSGTREFERMYEERKATNGFPADREPVRMVHHPNPYADAPSLYDLYVQASWPASGATRFGAEVFRRGAANPEVLPMDLPVGPDYVLGPGDSLSIDLWGGSVAAVVSCSGPRRAIGASGSGAVAGGRQIARRRAGCGAACAADAIPECFGRCFTAEATDSAGVRGGRSRVPGRLRREFAFDAAECVVCSGRSNRARIAEAAGALPREAARGRGGRLRFAAAWNPRRSEAAGEWRFVARAASGNFGDRGRNGSPAGAVRAARREKPRRGSRFGGRHPAGGGAAAHRSAAAGRA